MAPRKAKVITQNQTTNMETLLSDLVISDEIEGPSEEAKNGRGRARIPTPFDEKLQESYKTQQWKSVTIPSQLTKDVRRVINQVATHFSIGVTTKTESLENKQTKLWFKGTERTKRERKAKDE